MLERARGVDSHARAVAMDPAQALEHLLPTARELHLVGVFQLIPLGVAAVEDYHLLCPAHRESSLAPRPVPSISEVPAQVVDLPLAGGRCPE